MLPIDTASGIWVKPTQAVTKYIQAIDVCDSWRYDTVTVYAYPLSTQHLSSSIIPLKVYPNPAQQVLSVQTLSPQLRELYNSTGQLIFSTMENKIDVSKLARGFYYVKVGGASVRVVLE
jgi:hypothetical protein